MTDLIVDFPTRRSAPKKTKAVNFCNTAEMRIIEPIDAATTDTSAIWYTSREYKAMRDANDDAVRLARKALISMKNTTPDSVFDKMDTVTLNGIERFLTRDIIKRTKECRIQYVNAILDEQDLQDSAGIYDADRFALVARHHSKSAAKRARAIGLLHAR